MLPSHFPVLSRGPVVAAALLFLSSVCSVRSMYPLLSDCGSTFSCEDSGTWRCWHRRDLAPPSPACAGTCPSRGCLCGCVDGRPPVSAPVSVSTDRLWSRAQSTRFAGLAVRVHAVESHRKPSPPGFHSEDVGLAQIDGKSRAGPASGAV